MQNLEQIQARYLSSNDPNLLTEENEILKEIDKLSSEEETFWIQSARTKWINFGDRNTSYFQTQALIRKSRKRISYLKDEAGLIISEPSQITNKFRSSFQQRFTPVLVPLLLML